MYFFCLIIFIFFSNLNADLLRPKNLTSIHSIYGLFEWDQEPDATKYNLQISTNHLFESLILDTTISKLMYLENQNLNWNNEYYWRVRPIFEDDNVVDWIDTYSFHTGLLKTNPNDVIAEIYNEDLIQDGFTIYGNSMNESSVMHDKFGKEIWNDGILGHRVLHIDEFGQMYSSGLYIGSTHKNIPLKLNFHHEILWRGLDPSEPPYGMNAHDLKELPNGNFLYARDYEFLGHIPLGPWTALYQSLGYEADGETIEYPWQSTRLYEIDKNNHSILKEWDATDYFSTNVYDSIGATWNWSINLGYFDWIHNNSIWYDDLEDAVYLSSRQLSRITKIDYSTGEVIWMMGLPDEYVPSQFNDHICTELLFTFQHDAKILDNGHLLLYDNGNLSQIVRGTEYKTTRILEVNVLDDNTCDIVWEYDLAEEFHGASRGNVMKLDNGNYLINVATGSGKILEVTPEKEIVWILDLNPDGDYSNGNYRAFRVPSVYPDAYYVTIDSLSNNNSHSYGTTLNENDTFSVQIFNESGYDQDYHYKLSDTNNWINPIDEIITIEAQGSVDLTFEANNVNYNNGNLFSLIDFTIYPVHHEYAIKEFNFKIFENSSNIEEFNLLDAFPNPFNSSTNIIYDIPYSSQVNILIYNLNGQLVKQFSNDHSQKGRYNIKWNCESCSSGTYLMKMVTQEFSKSKKITLIK